MNSTTLKRHANRANACASTGPRTAAGKTRAAKNAKKHGLAVPVSCNRALSAEVEVVLDELVGKTASYEVKELARPIAEAHIDLRRVRWARDELIVGALDDPNYESRHALKKRVRLALELTRHPPGAFTDESVRALRPESEEPNSKHATILGDYAKRLAMFDRYERRALSRRKFAIRAFDAAGFDWAPASNWTARAFSTPPRSAARTRRSAAPSPAQKTASDAIPAATR